MNRKLLGFLLILMFSGTRLHASHMMGSDMSYKCLGNGKYHITAKIYRDCRGISFSGPTFGVFGGLNGGNGCGDYSLGITRTGIRDVTPRCSTASKPCSPTNTYGTGEGIEEHTYEVTVDFTKTPLSNFVNKSSCCEVTFYIGQCCRNGAITTGPAGNDFWTTCMINICNIPKTTNKCNSSPFLTNEPIGFLCCNQAYYFNNGAIDTVDYDSLSYRLTPGLSSKPSGSVSYSSPFTFQYPMTPYCVPPTTIKCAPNPKTNPPRGFFLDTASGDLIFTPTKCDEVGIVVIEIVEWRKDSATGKYLIIGKTRRDIQLIVKDDCGYNKAPTIEGPTVNKVCEGDKICFDIKGKDETFTPYQTIPDTVQMKWNQGIPGATFTIKNPTDREKTAEFCWQTRVGQASDVAYSFTVTATDDHCPKPTYSIRGFKVKVNPRAFDTRLYTILKCGRFAYEAKLPDGFKGVAQYKWSFRDSNGNNEFYFSSKKTDTMTFYKGGKFIIVHTVNNSDNCPTIYRDTVIIPDPPKAVLATADTFACYKTKLVLEATVISAKLPYKYYWTRPTQHISGDTFKSITLNSVDRDSTIQVRVTDGDGCIFYDTATVYMKPLPGKPNMPDQRICTYQTATFDALHADTMYYNWNTGDTTRTITKHIAGDYIVTITDTIWGCQMKDTAHLYVNDTVVALAGADKMICTNDKYNITANHRNSSLSATYQWSEAKTGGAVLGSNATYSVGPKNTNPPGGAAQYFSYDLYVKITQGGVTCEDHDTMTIKVNTLPIVSWTKNPLDPKCHDYGDITLNPLVTRPYASQRQSGNFRIWGSNTKYGSTGLVDSMLPDFHTFRTTKINNEKELSGGTYVEDNLTVWFKDTNGCVNTATTRQRINGNPVIVLDTSVYCQDKGWAKMDSSVIRPKTKFGTKQTWEVLEVPSGVNPDIILTDLSGGGGMDWEFRFGDPTEDYYAGDYVFKFSVTDVVTGCYAVDTTMIKIVPEPTVKVTPPSPVCLNWDTMDLRDYILLNGSKPVVGTQNWFTIMEYRYDRNDPKVSSTPLGKGYMFNPASGAGAWLIKFSSDETGCLKEDSFYLMVNDTPTAILRAPITLCSGSTPLDLNTRIVSMQPGSATPTWTGPSPWVTNGYFNPISKDSASLEGPYRIRLSVKDNNQCEGRYDYLITVRSQPEITITTNKPLQGCERDPYGVQSTSKYANGVNWTKIQGADGTIDNAASENIIYQHGLQDSANKYAWLKVTTIAMPNDVCPQVSDSIQILLFQYPAIDMQSPVDGCVPLTADFTGIETKGIPAGQLSWRWDFGNGDTSNLQNPTGVTFPTQGKYTFTLTVTNTAGPCATTIVRPDFVQAYPVPFAFFVTDPPKYTTVALPKFKTENRSTLDKSVFTNGSMTYHWDFDDPITDPNDTSTLQNPRYAYGKDTNTYNITLTVTSDKGCVSTYTQQVIIGPDIIVFIPDVFTPDGAGPNRNNTFMISAQNFKTMKMMVYNRWGEKMYETDDITKGWDGRANGAECQQDVYVYHVEVVSFEDKVYKFDGTITLLR